MKTKINFIKRLLLVLVVLITSINTARGAASSLYAGDRLYVNCTGWLGSNAAIKIVLYGTDGKSAGYQFAQQFSGDIYYIDINGTYNGFQICRLNPNNLNQQWNHTGVAWADQRTNNDYNMIQPGYMYDNDGESPISWQKRDYTLTQNKYIYYDNHVTGWTTPHVRIGKNSYCNAPAMTKQAGTANYWYYSKTDGSDWSGYHAFTISDGAGWTNDNNIFTSNDVGNRTIYWYEDVSDDITIIGGAQGGTVTNPSPSTNWYNATKSDGQLTYTVSTSLSHCEVSMVKYNNDAGTSTTSLSNGGSVLPTQYIKVTTTPSTGYQFSSVSVSNSTTVTTATSSVPGVYYITGNATVTATCTAKSYSITLNDNGGGSGDGTHSVTYDAAVGSLTNTPVKTNYAFCGYETSTHVKIFNADKTPVSSVAGYTDGSGNWIKDGGETLYAIWEDQYGIYGTGEIFASDWGTWVGFPNTGTNTYGKSITLTKGEDYVFKVVDRNTGASGTWWGNKSGTSTNLVIDRAASGTAQQLYSATAATENITITPDVTGPYTFSYNTSNNKLTITYPTSYTITFGIGDLNGSNSAITATASPSFSSGDYVLRATAVTFNKGTTKAGYDWKGWYSNSNGTGTEYSTTDGSYTSSANTRSANMTIYACYSYQTYSITYKDQGNVTFSGTHGDGYPTTHTYNTGTNLVDPTKTGYDFDGWYTNSACDDDPITSIGATAYTDNITLYAKWIAKEYTVTLDDRSATTAVSPSSVKATYNANTLSSSITNPAKTGGYTFAGWYLEYETGSGIGTSQLINTSGALNASVSPYTDGSRNWVNDGDVTVYARWKANANVDKFNFQYGSGTYYGSTWTVANFGDATNNKRTVDFTMPDPSSKKCYVGWGGDFIASGLGSGSGWSSEINLTDVRLEPCTSATVGTATGATGKLVIWDNSSSANLYVGFEPSGYAVGTADRNIALTAGADNFYYTDVVTITSTEAAGNFQVKLATSSSYTTCGHGTAENASTVSGRKIEGDADIANGSKGVFQMWNNSNTNNFGLRFVTVYDVEFNLQGHGDAIDDYTDVRYNDKISAPTDPTADGYVFHGWFKEAGCVNEWDFASDVVTTGTTLYAKWTSNIGTINAVSGTNGVYRATYGAKTISITTEPTRTGYEVEAYYLNYNAGYQNPYSNPIATSGGTLATNTAYTDEYGNWDYEGNAPTIYANWQNKTYTITLDENIPDGTEGSAGDASFTAQYNTNTFSTISNYPTAVGYTFAGYYDDPDDEDVLVIKDAAHSYAKNTGTIYIDGSGNWISSSEDLTLYAHWTANEYTITLDDRNATSAVSPGAVTATFASNSLASITAPRKWGNIFGGWETSGGILVIDEDGDFVESVTDYTDASGNWKRDGSVTLYAKWTPKSNLYWISGTGSEVSGGTAFTSAGGGKYYLKADLVKDATFHLADGDAVGGPASNTNFTLATSAQSIGSNSTYFQYNGTQKQTFVFVLDINTLKLSFENFVIYKPGEKSGDGHTAYASVEGFSGNIYGDFEFRMRVDEIGKWSTLYLPFTTTKVQVWDGAYYDIYPCHRSGGTLMQGYYVIRTPESKKNLPIKDFDKWNDPTYYTAWVPTKETPYIIQWQMGYFIDKYISFWGNDADIVSFDAGAAPTTDGVVNILGNGTLGTVGVEGAYVLNDDYGSGAWLRGAEPTDEVSVGPFECYILASATTTANTLVIKRRTGDDTTTGLDDILNYETKEVITVYTISGLRVAQYNDCSFEEAGRRMNAELSEGIYIMNAGNESVKLIIR